MRWLDALKNPKPFNGDQAILAESLANILKIVSLWPTGNRDNSYYIRLVCTYLLCAALNCGFIGYIYYNTSQNNFDYYELADTIATLCASLSCLTSFFWHATAQPTYAQLLVDLGDFRQYEKPAGIEKLNAIVNFLMQSTFIWMLLSMGGILALKYIENCDDGVVNDCALVSSVEGYFASCMVLVIIEFIVNRLEHLKNMIPLIPVMKNRDERKAYVRKCVQYHQKIIEFADRLYESTYYFLFFDLPSVSIIMTLLMHLIITRFTYKVFAHFLIWFSHISVTCILGERLVYSSLDVANVIYMNIPFDNDLETQQELKMMILRSRKMLRISGGLSGESSHEKLMEILKTSYSFLMLLTDLE